MKMLPLEENNASPLEKSLKEEMDTAIKHFERELVKIRTGRAHTSLIEDILVTCYGASTMPLKQLASLAAPEARLLTIQPWDSSIISCIEKAILSSDIGLTPVNDGVTIRLQFPEMSTSRREELTKILGKKLEECKISIRNMRKEFNNLIRDAKKEKEISENFFNRLTEIIQETTDTYIELAEALNKKKTLEITTV